MKIDSILIIDDEIDVCILLRNYLIKKNKTVDFATNLKDGIEKFRRMKPDLLILDHNISNEYGTENITTFKNLNKSSIVVIISAASIKQEALNKGADFFLEKPLTYSSLNNTLKK